jgi:hypothetical protein
LDIKRKQERFIMNKKFLAVAIPAALFAGSVSAYDVVTSDSTTVGLSGEVGVKYTNADFSDDDYAEGSTTSVTGGAASLSVAVKHSLDDTTDALGNIKFKLKDDGGVDASDRYFGLSLVGGEHIVKYGAAGQAGQVGPLETGYKTSGDVLRYTFSNDDVTVDASFVERAADKTETKDGKEEVTKYANAVRVKASLTVSDVEVDAGVSQLVKGNDNKETLAGLKAKTSFDPVTVTVEFGSHKDVDVAKTGIKGSVDYQATDELELSASYKVVSQDNKDNVNTATLGAEYVMDKWTFNADYTNVSDDSNAVELKAEYKFTDQFKTNVSAKNTTFEADDKDAQNLYIASATLTW